MIAVTDVPTWEELVVLLDVPATTDPWEQVCELRARRLDNLTDIAACHARITDEGSAARHVRYIAVSREEIRLAELYLDAIGEPYEEPGS